jgi:hypothetical protein
MEAHVINTCPLVWFFQSKELQTEPPLQIYLDNIVNLIILHELG